MKREKQTRGRGAVATATAVFVKNPGMPRRPARAKVVAPKVETWDQVDAEIRRDYASCVANGLSHHAALGSAIEVYKTLHLAKEGRAADGTPAQIELEVLATLEDGDDEHATWRAPVLGAAFVASAEAA